MFYPKIHTHLHRIQADNSSSSRSVSNTRNFTLPILTPSKNITRHKSDPKKDGQSKLFKKCEQIMREKLKYSNNIKTLKFKLQRMQKLRETYGEDIPDDISLTPAKLKKLENDAKIKHKTKVLSEAVDKIESWWKKRIIKKKLENFDFVQQNCAIKIQAYWRKFITRKKFLKALKLMQEAAVVIQKWVRGYLVRKTVSLKMKELKMFKAFEYFGQLKEEIMKESAERIQSFWVKARNFVKKKHEKKANLKINVKQKTVDEISYAAFPEPESKSPGVVNRKKLSIKPIITKRGSNPASPAIIPKRSRILTENLAFLEPIKEDSREIKK